MTNKFMVFKFKHYFFSIIYYKKRSFLSVIGVALGVAILIIVLSLGNSLKSYINNQMEAFGQKILFIAPKPPELNEMGAFIAQAQGVKITTLKEKDLKDLDSLPYVEAVTGNVMATEWVHFGNSEKQVMIIGVYPSYASIDESFKISMGRMFRVSENEGLAKVAVIGDRVSKDFFKNKNPLGKYIKIRNLNFKVIGVTEKRGSFAFLDMDSLIFVPAKTLQKLLLGIDYFSEADLKVDRLNHLFIVKKLASKVLRQNHNIKFFKKADFEIMTSKETIERTSKIILILDILLFLLASVSLVVGGVGIMNMMLIAVKERTREIGLRKAVGAKNSDIIFQFLIETIVTTALGAILGIILGIAVIILIFLLLGKLGVDWPLRLSLPAIYLSLLLTFFEGLIFGILPAYQAGRRNPTEALRN